MIIVCNNFSGKGDDDRQDGSSQRVDGDEGEGKDSAQGPWKPLPGSTPAAAVGTPAVASIQKKPEPCGRLLNLCLFMQTN